MTAEKTTSPPVNSGFFARLLAGPQAVSKAGPAPPLDDLLQDGARLMWIGAHPDDESFAGPIIARASIGLGNPTRIVAFTLGEGGLDARTKARPDNLAEIRLGELEKVAEGYKAELRVERFFNAPLPVSSFPTRQELARRWAEEGDPVAVATDEIRTFRPDVLLTFPPLHGCTGHPEHQAASRFATAGVRRAAEEAEGVPGTPYRVPHVYYLLNRYWFGALLGGRRDPFPWTERFNPGLPCGPGRTAVQVASELTRFHETQGSDMAMMRRLMGLYRWQYLYRVDPFEEIAHPFE